MKREKSWIIGHIIRGKKNEYLHLIVLLTPNKCKNKQQGIHIWLNGISISSLRYKKYVWYKIYLRGIEEQKPNSKLLLSILPEWFYNSNLVGLQFYKKVPYAHLRLKWNEKVWGNNIPKIECSYKSLTTKSKQNT